MGKRMNRDKETMKSQLFLILLGLLTGFSSFAQQNKVASFSIQVAYDTVGLEEQIEVKYTLKNAKAVAPFATPTFDGFQLLAGPMTSQSMSVINGDMTQSVSYIFILKPTELGIYNIIATSIETEEGVLITDDVALIVVEKVERPRYNSPSNAFQDPFSNNPFFNDPFFNQQIDPRQQMDEMRKNFDKMFRIESPTYDPNGPKAPNQAPQKKKPKKKEKVYKI